jgi:hypothetical protein
MELPRDLSKPHTAVVALASFVRARLAEVGDSLGPLFRRDEAPALTGDIEHSRRSARQLATVIVAAASPFATTSYARARLLRQMHASGLLSDEEAEQTREVLGVAQ